jgi:hypothetical protein
MDVERRRGYRFAMGMLSAAVAPILFGPQGSKGPGAAFLTAILGKGGLAFPWFAGGAAELPCAVSLGIE